MVNYKVQKGDTVRVIIEVLRGGKTIIPINFCSGRIVEIYERTTSSVYVRIESLDKLIPVDCGTLMEDKPRDFECLGNYMFKAKKSRKFYSARYYWRKKSKRRREMSRLAFRARQLKCPVIIPFSKAEIIKRDGLICYLCGKTLTEKQVTIDHYIPLSKGGFHCPSNARICCITCNKRKGNKID